MLQHGNFVNNTIGRFKKQNLLSKKLADGLKSVNLKMPKFYISLKIHTFFDYHLQHLLKEIPSYVKDTNDFINKINIFAVPPNSFLLTMNVKSLYASIPNNKGIASVKKKYDHYPNKTIPTKIIITFLALILTLNNFVFNSKLYLQIKGYAMGTICAPSYANTSCQNSKKNIYTP